MFSKIGLLKSLSILSIALGIFGIFASFMALREHWIGMGEERVQARWDAQVQQQQTAAARYEAVLLKQVRAKESQLNKTNERINHDYVARELDKDARIADLLAELGRLQHALNNSAPRHCGVPATSSHARSSAAADDSPASAEQLLGECGQRYAELAAEAARLANQVIGLQQYAAMCQRRGEE